MENQNDKLILDENVNESKDSYTSPLIYRFVSNLYNLVSVVLLLASLVIFAHTVYLYFTNPPIGRTPYYDSFYTEIHSDNIAVSIIFFGFIPWIGLTIFFYALNLVKHGRLAQKKWVLFNTVSGIMTFMSLWWLFLLFD